MGAELRGADARDGGRGGVRGSGWDEAGRCLGLYLDGDTNTPLIGQSDRRGGHTAWGYGTANQSFAVDGEAVLLHNTAGEVVRFRWTPGDIDSVRYVSTHALPPVVGDGGEDEVGDDRRPAADDEALHWERREAMALRGDTLVLVRDGRRVEVFDAVTLERRGGFGADELRDVCFGSADTLWLIEGDAVVERRLSGERTGRRIDDAGRPWALAVAPDGRLVVCDAGPRQQVRVYDVAAGPVLVATFGVKGGLAAGTPGEVTDDTLWSLTGANFDAAGRLHVASSDRLGTVLHTLAADGSLERRLHSLPFCNAYAFDPRSDGRVLIGTDEVVAYDPNLAAEGEPGRGWSLRARTIDPVPGAAGHDPDRHRMSSTLFRRVDGRGLLFMRTMNGLDFHVSLLGGGEDGGGGTGHFARRVGELPGGWAMSVEPGGHVWHGDAPGGEVLRHRLTGWDADGSPRYDLTNPERYAKPEGFAEVCRLVYVPETDSLYVGGYREPPPPGVWGLAGAVLARYDGWVSGVREKRWEVDLLADDAGLNPKDFVVEGEYVFAAACKPIDGQRGVVWVHSAEDGAYVGALMAPTRALRERMGWVDILGGVAAFHQSNGRYLVLVEDNGYAKQVIYQWRPKEAAPSR